MTQRALAAVGSAAVLFAPGTASASFLSGETLDTAANVLAWVVLVLVPVVAIVLFWMVHVLPEKIAHKNHHPQRKAIQTLCLLSLVFGGLLWPLAWLWAYTKPVGYKLAYGTEMHEDFFLENAERWRKGELPEVELRQLRAELDAVEARGALTPALRSLRDELASGGTRSVEAAPAAAVQARGA
jgi:Protein of unknown function (DUF3302)